MTAAIAPPMPTPAATTPPPAASIPPAEPYGGLASIRKITVDEYHQMIKHGILKLGEPVELLEGYLVKKMPRSPQHDFTIRTLSKRLFRIVPDEFVVSCQCAATLEDSEPEPDICIARGPEERFRTRHPEPEDMLLVMESSASSLPRDRGEKARIYARVGVPVYWIVNVEEHVIEVYSQPTGPTAQPGYAKREDYKPGDTVPIILNGIEVGRITVVDVMP